MDWRSGQERRAWLENQGQNAVNALSYYLGPGVPVENILRVADMFNPVADMTRAGTAARGVVRPGATVSERVNALGNVATDMASVLAPVAGAAYADDAARGLTEALANWSMPADDAVTRFVGSEYGGVKAPGYGIEHRPMTVDGGAATLDDLTAAFGDDIYGPQALQYFGSGDPREKAVLRALQSARGNPDATVTIYRGVPEGVTDINAGDWVTLDPRYAAEYGNVISREVPARDVTAWADSLAEQGYYPQQSLSPAEAAGQNVLDLLKSGRASEVTDDMLDLGDPVLNAQLNDYLFRNYDLPMDEASRMARAREMGFTEDAIHGTVTGAEFSGFKGPSARGHWQESYFAPNTEDGRALVAQFSSGDQGRVFPVKIKGESIMDTRTEEGLAAFRDALDEEGILQDWELGLRQGGELRSSGLPGWGDPRVLHAAGKKNPEGVRLHERDWVESTAVFDPTQIRSRFARFDPRLAHLRNLSAGVGGLGIAVSQQSEQERSADINDILAKYGVN